MPERINEIIEFLIDEISQLTGPVGLNIEKISAKLRKQGYTEREIHKAVEWVILNLNEDPRKPSPRSRKNPPPSLRTLISEELNYFTPAAHGCLIQLQTLGILNALQVEQVIERCFLAGISQADIDEVKMVVSQFLLGKELRGFDTDAVYHPGNDKVN